MSVEKIVAMPILNPDTGQPSRTFEYAGKVDEIKDATVIDYKGTANSLRFIVQKKIGFQGECYAIACAHGGHPISIVDYRLITRPTIKYRKPTFTWAVKREGAKRALRVFDVESEARTMAELQGAGIEKRVDGHEDRRAYEDACLDWLCDPEYPYRVVPHTYDLTMPRLETAQRWLWNSCKRLLECRATGRWMPNEQACFAHNRECSCLPLCEAVAEGSDVRWVKEQDYQACDPHPELNGHKGKLLIVTYSSLTCLALCEVKYFWKYHECLRRRTGEAAESLWIGSAMHRGMEVLGSGADMDVALTAVDEWAQANPVLGEDPFWIQEQQIARARAMVRAGSMKWGRT